VASVEGTESSLETVVLGSFSSLEPSQLSGLKDADFIDAASQGPRLSVDVVLTALGYPCFVASSNVIPWF
jgi:hypothetical protein